MLAMLDANMRTFIICFPGSAPRNFQKTETNLEGRNSVKKNNFVGVLGAPDWSRRCDETRSSHPASGRCNRNCFGGLCPERYEVNHTNTLKTKQTAGWTPSVASIQSISTRIGESEHERYQDHRGHNTVLSGKRAGDRECNSHPLHPAGCVGQ
jgi:hypothetical protein